MSRKPSFVLLSITVATGLVATTSAFSQQAPQTAQALPTSVESPVVIATPPPHDSRLGPLAPVSPNAHKAVNMTPAIEPDSPVMPAFQAERAGDYEKAAALLRPLDPRKMDENNRRRWRIMAKNVGVRTGDKELVERANAGFVDQTHFVSGREIMNAYSQLLMGDIAKAKEILGRVMEPQKLDERSRRRYLAIWARINQLENKPKDERVYVAKLVDYAGHWRTPICQECHTNPERYGDEVVSLDVRSWWPGQRFAALLAQFGDAKRVRRESEVRLAKNPKDEQARLRLAYALRAEGDEAGCDRELRKISWAAFPDRPYKAPIDVMTFP